MRHDGAVSRDAILDPALHRARRVHLLERLGDGLLLLPTALETVRNGDVLHEYRPGSDFHFLTGFPDRPPARPNLSLGDSLAGRLVMYDALTTRFYETSLSWNPENPLSGRKPSIISLESGNYI